MWGPSRGPRSINFGPVRLIWGVLVAALLLSSFAAVEVIIITVFAALLLNSFAAVAVIIVAVAVMLRMAMREINVRKRFEVR